MDVTWRLILDGKASAAFNMAADEAILRAYADGEVPATLRLYGWDKPAISLGYFQRIEGMYIDIEYCNSSGIGIVRRPTGGRAVLHGHDVTFSVCLDERLLPRNSRGVRASHQWIMAGIAAGLKLLDLESELGGDLSARRKPNCADCFEYVAPCDLRVGEVKVAGAAQVRKWGALLEQGSIPHVAPEVDPERIFGRNGRMRQTHLADFSAEAIRQAVVKGFEQASGVVFQKSALTAEEMESALELERTKYASERWTYLREAARIDNDM
jgi:lipoate-protein ligase A